MDKQELEKCGECKSTTIATVNNLKGDVAFSCYNCGYIHNLWDNSTEEATHTWNRQMKIKRLAKEVE